MKEKSTQVIDSVRNLLILDPENREIKLDLVSLNLQRARDHGLSGFNRVRTGFGLPRIKDFSEVTKNET